jgi:thiosulfate dehydrogenase
MKFRLLITLSATALAVFTLVTFACASSAPDQATRSDTQRATLVTGGLLYDNWAKMVGAKPEGNHPLYPADAKKSGSSTWRCKECHGWDYIGAEGRYSKGSHYTGTPGVLGAKTLSEAQLVGALSGDIASHSFSEFLSREELQALAVFIRQGQLDWKGDVDLTDGAGNISAGKESYENLCADCHGADGNELDFKKKDGTQGVGWLANDNPQETLHKIRWGHPGSDMPSAVVDGKLDEAATIDLLRYCLTLP